MEIYAKRFAALASCVSLATMTLIAGTAAAPIGAESAGRYCRPSETDHVARLIPSSLVPIVQKTFGFPALQDASYFRCVDGHLLVCTIGANEPCGKANTRRAMPSATEFCRRNPSAAVIPMAVTGHDTIFSGWRCTGRIAVPGGPVANVDKQGFVAEHWEKVD